MALTTTTLSGAITASAQSLVVASATGLVANDFLIIDQEIMRVGKSYVSGTTVPIAGRGLNGTQAAAHVTGANLTHGEASEFANAAPQAAVGYPLAGRARQLTSYSASGAITLPTPGADGVAIINGTSILAMTIAAPSKDMDGCLLYVASNGAAAHTVQYTGGLSGAGSSYDLLTVNAGAPVLFVTMAVNGTWIVPVTVAMTGTLTNLIAALG